MLHQIVAEFGLDDLTMRLAAPGDRSHYRRHGRWQPMEPDRLTGILHDSRAVPYRLLLCPRDDSTSPATRVLEAGTGTPAKASARVGWPVPLLTTAATVQQVIDSRSNDYRHIEHGTRVLGAALGADDQVSVVVPARNSQDSLDAVVASVAAAASEVTWECIVVDDASDTPLRVDAAGGRVRVIRSDRRLYSGGARNLGVRYARYDTVLFCDSDTLLPHNYFTAHLPLHRTTPYLITMSMRDEADERVSTVFGPDWVGLDSVHQQVSVSTLQETGNWRHFGMGRRAGPVALQFVVWSHNLCISRRVATAVTFPEDYVGWGLEDNAFGAAAIVYGCFVYPVLEAPVRHLTHPPRSGGEQQRDREFRANLDQYLRMLTQPVQPEWRTAAHSSGGELTRVSAAR